MREMGRQWDFEKRRDTAYLRFTRTIPLLCGKQMEGAKREVKNRQEMTEEQR